jgi:arylformamidase
MADWIFLSHALGPETPVYGNRKGFSSVHTSQICHGASSNSSEWTFPNHIGTHVDAPFHFSELGATVEIPRATHWHFKDPILVDCPQELSGLVTVEDVRPKISSVEKSPDCLLLRTGFERFRGQDAYWKCNPGISPSLGTWLRKEWPSIRMVGIDCISISRWQDRQTGRIAHKEFLSPGQGSPVWILEDMHLSHVPILGISELVALPIRVKGSDGGPCTVIARLSGAQ